MQDVARDKEIVVLGVFDGVHLGHQELVKEGLAEKRRQGLPLTAVTFDPHPRTLTGSGAVYNRLLTPPIERCALLSELGVDNCLSLRFTTELARTGPKDFAVKYLRDMLRSKTVICGFNFTFGHRGSGKPGDLQRFGRELGFDVIVVPPYVVGGSPVSSTRIRQLLACGDVSGVRHLLGRPYILTGRVVRGDGRGRTMGFPTSNLSIGEDKLLPANGVYAALVRVKILGSGSQEALDREARLAVVNIGTRPTFNGLDVRVEVHMPGFSGDLYGAGLQVIIVDRIRDEMYFADRRDLVERIREDIREASALVSGQFTEEAVTFNLVRAYDKILASELP